MIARVEKQRIKAIPDEEPIFILRAQDVSAPDVIEFWCELATTLGVRSGKIAGARRVARDMEAWPVKKVPD